MAAAVARWRLFRLLDDLAEQPCTWIHAPGGFGKTYLISSYVTELNRRALWYALDEGDSDVGVFFADFGEGIAAAGLGQLVKFSPEVQVIGRFSRLYFQELAAAVGEQATLVLDDYHRIAADSPLHDAIAEALEWLPPTLRLVVLSRESPPPAFTRAVSHLKIGLIDAATLALTNEEAIEFASRIGQKHLSDEAVAAACRQVAGWATGYVLMLRQSDPSVLAPSTAAMLTDYFEHEVLRSAPRTIRDVLWQTAIFPTMTVAMVARLTDRSDAAALLRELASANYFLYRGQDQNAVYHYHDLFRDFLLEFGRQSYPDRWPDIARRAAEILSDAGDPESAANIYESLDDWDGLAQLVRRNSPQALRRGSIRTLERWLSILPAPVKEQDPWLLYWEGCAALATDPRRARDLLSRAFSSFVSSGQMRGALLAWGATCQAFFLAFDDLRPLGEWLERLYTLLPPSQTMVPEDIEAQIAPGVFLCLMVTQPAATELSRWERVLLRLIESNQHPSLSAMAATLQILHFAYTIGDRARSLRLREALRALQRCEGMAPIGVVLLGGIAEVVYQYSFGGSAVQTLNSLRAAKDLAKEQGIKLYDASLYGALAYCHLAAGDRRNAGKALDQMGRVLDWERKWDVGFYIEMRSWDAWLGGRFAQAWELAQQAISLKDNFGMLHTRPMAHIAVVQTASSLGRRAEALAHLAAIRQWSRSTGSRIGPFMRGMALAQLALWRDRRYRVRKILKLTFTLGQVEGYVNSHFFRREDLTALCAEALNADIAQEYVMRFIRSRELPPPVKAEDSERWPWPVRVHTFGGFRLEMDSGLGGAGEKVRQKPIELLKALIAEGGVSVDQRRLTDLLWPEAEGDMAAHSLKTTVSRLRKLMKRRECLVVHGNSISLNRDLCWTDTWRFDEVAEAINAAAQTGVRKMSLPELEDLAVRLYRAYPGLFLHGCPDDWVEAYRLRIHRRYERCVSHMVGAMKAIGAEDAASTLAASALSLAET